MSRWIITIVAVLAVTLCVVNPAIAAGTVVIVEDRVVVSPENGDTTHCLRLVVPDGNMNWQFDTTPSMDGVDIGWRFPKIDWGKDFKVQPRLIMQLRDGQDLGGIKLQSIITGKPGYAFGSVRFADGQKASYYGELQWDAAPGKDLTGSLIGLVSGKLAEHGHVATNLGPAITFHFDGKADLQFYYGFGLARQDGDTAWAQLDFYIPTN